MVVVGVVATPVPASETALVVTAALWEMVSVAERTPGAAGVKVRVMLQLADTASAVVGVQVPPTRANSLLLILIAESCNVAAPVLESMTVCWPLVLPALTAPKPSVVLDSEATGAVLVALGLLM